MSDPRCTHNDLHSERGALAGEHSGRATNPVIKVHDLAWLGFQKPDLARAETFAHAFGFAAVVRTASDAMAAGGQYLIDQGYYRSWGIGRHIQGSQIFDYWRDPDGFLVEHFADGDRFDCTLEPGWAPMTASGLAQWGPSVTRDFLGVSHDQARSRHRSPDDWRRPMGECPEARLRRGPGSRPRPRVTHHRGSHATAPSAPGPQGADP